MDHVLAILPEFGLNMFQNLSGNDITDFLNQQNLPAKSSWTAEIFFLKEDIAHWENKKFQLHLATKFQDENNYQLLTFGCNSLQITCYWILLIDDWCFFVLLIVNFIVEKTKKNEPGIYRPTTTDWRIRWKNLTADHEKCTYPVSGSCQGMWRFRRCHTPEGPEALKPGGGLRKRIYR